MDAAIEITTKVGCSISCSYCPQDKFVKAYAANSNIYELSFEIFKTCLNKIPLGVEIVFSGMCEPFLNSDCIKMLSYAHTKGYRIGIDTTLTGLRTEDVDLLVKIPFAHFSVHLPSAHRLERIEVNEQYLDLLKRISKSNINIFYKFHGSAVDSKVKSIIKNKINWSYLVTRSGNILIKNSGCLSKHKGTINCLRNFHWNILLPNGDVLLCSSDYGMQHVLGNLLSNDYNFLFQGEAFLKVMNALGDESSKILCRYCDTYAFNTSWFGKPLYYWNKIFSNIRNTKDFLHFVGKIREIPMKFLFKKT